MSQEKYIGMDVHQATISVAVMDGNGKLLMECLLETKAATILEFVQGLQDPAGENRCFHGHRPGLRKRLHPAVQFPACCSDLAFLVNLTAGILDAVADRLLVNTQSDVIHMSFEEPPWLFSESTFVEFSFLYTTRSSLDLAFKQSVQNRRIRCTPMNGELRLATCHGSPVMRPLKGPRRKYAKLHRAMFEAYPH
jgi:hypothetical protein